MDKLKGRVKNKEKMKECKKKSKKRIAEVKEYREKYDENE